MNNLTKTIIVGVVMLAIGFANKLTINQHE